MENKEHTLFDMRKVSDSATKDPGCMKIGDMLIAIPAPEIEGKSFLSIFMSEMFPPRKKRKRKTQEPI